MAARFWEQQPPRAFEPWLHGAIRSHVGSPHLELFWLYIFVAAWLVGDAVVLVGWVGDVLGLVELRPPVWDELLGSLLLQGGALLWITLGHRAVGRRRARLEQIALEGKLESAVIESNAINWSTQQNDVPERVLRVRWGDRKRELRTFDHTWADRHPEGSAMDVLVHARWPDEMVPVSQLTPRT